MTDELLPNNLLTTDEWEDYVDTKNMIDVGYIDATEQTTEYIEAVLEKAQTFAELKEELLKFSRNRKAFIAYANTHTP